MAFAFLVILISFQRVFELTFYSGMSVATNRLVDPTHRAILNGLVATGGSLAKTIAPAFAGLFIAFVFSSGLFPPQATAAILFGTMGVIGAVIAHSTCYLLKSED